MFHVGTEIEASGLNKALHVPAPFSKTIQDGCKSGDWRRQMTE
jgi:hypothetical protein